MEVRNVGRVAVDQWLRMARAPFGAVAHLLPSDSGQRDAALLAIDRAEATVRAALGGLLKDHALRQEASRRRAAVDERFRALELRRKADDTKRAADSQLASDLNASGRQREQAESEGQQRRQKVAEERSERQRQVERRARAELGAVEDAEEQRLAATDKRAKRDRLKVLEEQTAALDRQADALTASDEAQRLRNAAGAAKAARKGTT
jgi:hypothetical protein